MGNLYVNYEQALLRTDYNVLTNPNEDESVVCGCDARCKSDGTRFPQSKTRRYHRIVHHGFFYNISTTRRGNRRYYRCANKRNSGCLATAVLATNAALEALTILRPHNHPPDNAMEMRYNFEMELTKAVKSSNASIKNLYDSLAEIYPEAAKLVPYDHNLCSRLKRRRVSPRNMFNHDFN